MPHALTIQHYRDHIEPLINGCEEKECHAYWSATRNIAKDQITDEAQKDVLLLFDAVVSFMLSPSSPGEPFKPILIMEGRRSPIPSDLKPEHRDYLQEILPAIADAEMRARIADTLWTLKHGTAHVHAETAITAYLDSADTLRKKSWRCAYERLERALRIFLQLGLNRKDVADNLNAPQKIKDFIKKEKSAKPPYLPMRLIELLHESHYADDERYAAILEDIAGAQEAFDDHNTARDAWALAGQLHKSAKKREDMIRCQCNAAETYVKLADVAEKGEHPSYMLICGWLQSAVEAYRTIPEKQQRRDELYDRLLQAQPRIHKEMKVISTNVDVSDIVKQVIEEVSGKNIFTALYKFAFLLHPPELEEIKEQMEEQARNAPLSSIFPATFHDRKGRVVAKSSLDDSIENRMHRHVAQFHRNFYARSVLWPALQQIRLEHNISLHEWIGFVRDHPFVPPERTVTYAYGLFHGFHGDFLSAAHILIPQIENSIRYILNNYEKQTSRQIAGGIQEESSLNQTLECAELKEMLGENIVFDLKGLLIEKIGENLRNTISHGLMDDDQMFKPEIVYLYWLTLHIIFLPVKVMVKERQNSQSAQG